MTLEDVGDVGEDLVANNHVSPLPVLGALRYLELVARFLSFVFRHRVVRRVCGQGAAATLDGKGIGGCD